MVLESLVSDLDTSTILVFLVVALVTWICYVNRNLPPGPWGLPVLGYLAFLDPKIPAEEQFHKLSKKYGNVMSMQLGSYLTVILDDYASIKEAYIKKADVFSDRPEGRVMKVHDEDVGVINTSGERWKEVRRFALSTLRDYGMGKLSLEPRIIEEVHFFLEELAKQKGQPFDLTSILGMSTANIVATLEFGKRYEYSDPKFIYMRKLVDDLVGSFSQSGARAMFKWFKYIPYADRLSKHTFVANIQDEYKLFLNEIVDEHKRRYQESCKADFIDAFITEQKAVRDKNGSIGYFDEEELVMTLQTLFMAGTETTTNTIRWALLIILMHPEMQDKIHEEIDNVIGLERAPTMGDRPQTKYIDAFLHETQRFGNIVPVNVMHATSEETELNGFRIPKGANVLTNLWAVHNDPKLWKSPEKFMPERFFNAKGQVEKPEYLIPFGIGKRSCLGEALARNELYLYFTSIMQRFTILSPEGIKPKLAFESTIIRRPKLFKLCAVERKGYHVLY